MLLYSRIGNVYCNVRLQITNAVAGRGTNELFVDVYYIEFSDIRYCIIYVVLQCIVLQIRVTFSGKNQTLSKHNRIAYRSILASRVHILT